MKSPARSHAKSGFTLFEVLVVLALFGVIATLSIGIGINTFRSQVFDSEVSLVTSFLQTARNRAMNNVLQSQHGVRIESDQIVLYAVGGDEYAVPRNDTVEITGDDEIIFEQLSGETDPNQSLTLSNDMRTVSVAIDANGRIDWHNE